MGTDGTAAPRAAIFDLDGVVVDNVRFHREAWRTLFREEGLELTDPEFWRLTIGHPVSEALPRLLGRPLSAETLSRLARRRVALYHELADGQAAAVPGVVEFVRALEAAGVPQALATSAQAPSAAAILDALGLAESLAIRVTAGDVQRGKPDPEVYLTAAARPGVAPTACVVFEDALAGIEAARRAGMAVVGLTTAYPAAELLAAGAAITATDFRALRWEDLPPR